MFWAVFFIIIAGLFWINRDIIRTNYARLASRFSGRELPAAPLPPPEPLTEPDPPPQEPAASSPPPAAAAPPKADTPAQTARPDAPREKPGSPPSPAQPGPAAQPSAQPVNPAAEQRPAPEPARERNIYFTQVDREGRILRSKTARRIPASDSPMLDTLNALLQGPAAEEQRQGMVSLIPPGSRILSATVRGSTAYISFSEEFQYNTYGVEGYAAQLKQIVWTATEFSNVQDVQILIEGRRIDYLGEGIWIGSPLGREGL
jgi:outer membrane biosynthesis protein TonB